MTVFYKVFLAIGSLSQPANGYPYSSKPPPSEPPPSKPALHDYRFVTQLCGSVMQRDFCLPPDNQRRSGKTSAASISQLFQAVTIKHTPHAADPKWTNQLTLVLDILNELGLDVRADRLPALYVNVYTPSTGEDPALPKYVKRGELRCINLPETAYNPTTFTHEALHFVFDRLKQPNLETKLEKTTDNYETIIQIVEDELGKLKPSDFGRFPADIINMLNRVKQDPAMKKTYYPTHRALAEEYIVILTTSLIVSDSRVSNHQTATLKDQFQLKSLILMFLNNPPEKSEL